MKCTPSVSHANRIFIGIYFCHWLRLSRYIVAILEKFLLNRNQIKGTTNVKKILIIWCYNDIRNGENVSWDAATQHCREMLDFHTKYNFALCVMHGRQVFLQPFIRRHNLMAKNEPFQTLWNALSERNFTHMIRRWLHIFRTKYATNSICQIEIINAVSDFMHWSVWFHSEWIILDELKLSF